MNTLIKLKYIFYIYIYIYVYIHTYIYIYMKYGPRSNYRYGKLALTNV